MSAGSILLDSLGAVDQKQDPDGVPVIDGSDLCKSFEDGSLSHNPIVSQIRDACTRWGFFQLVNHGIPSEGLILLQEEAKRFFSLPLEKKVTCKRSVDNAWGFFNDELTKQKLDMMEGFDVGHPPRPDLPDDAPENKTLDGANRWPSGEPVFRETIEQYLKQVEQIAFALTGAFAAGLGLQQDSLRQLFQPYHSAFLRLNYYPPPSAREGPLAAQRNEAVAGEEPELGIHPHKDAGFLTVIVQGMVAGLQVYDTQGGQWHTVEPIEDALVINVGDMAQVLSNDKYKAPLHRVLASKDVPRYSAPYFFNPSYDAVCGPLPPCIDAEHPPAFRPVPWGEFRLQRYAGDYADLGEEIQIDHYRLPASGQAAAASA
eukprot:jgi/Botrbrau1/6798/Bobra.0153s0001.1